MGREVISDRPPTSKNVNEARDKANEAKGDQVICQEISSS